MYCRVAGGGRDGRSRRAHVERTSLRPGPAEVTLPVPERPPSAQEVEEEPAYPAQQDSASLDLGPPAPLPVLPQPGTGRRWLLALVAVLAPRSATFCIRVVTLPRISTTFKSGRAGATAPCAACCWWRWSPSPGDPSASSAAGTRATHPGPAPNRRRL